MRKHFDNCLQVPGIRQHLGDDRPPRLGVLGELHLDNDQTARGFDGDQVRFTAAQPHLSAQHGQPRRSGQRQHLRCGLHQVVQRCFRWERSRCERLPPAAGTRTPYRSHRWTLERPGRARLPRRSGSLAAAVHFLLHLLYPIHVPPDVFGGRRGSRCNPAWAPPPAEILTGARSTNDPPPAALAG